MGTLKSHRRGCGIIRGTIYLSHYTHPYKPVSMTNPAWRVTKRRAKSDVRNTASNEESQHTGSHIQRTMDPIHDGQRVVQADAAKVGGGEPETLKHRRGGTSGIFNG